MPDKYNPFRPDKIMPPGMFAGRLDEINYINGCLRQGRFGNPKHFMLIGERGIGKSSLILLTKFLAEGNIHLTDQKNDYKYLVISVALRREDSFLNIIARISRQLKKECDQRHDAFGNLVFKALEIVSRFEAAGVKYNHAPRAVEEEAFASLQDDIELALLKAGDTIDGVLILIDEADAPPAEAGLGLLCKLLTEELAKRQMDRVCIGLAGLPQLPQKVLESHESALRLFHIMTLRPLEPAERTMVLDIGLQEANRHNPIPTSISPDAASAIAEYSEGYPHFLQEFAYCAFEEDSDGTIDRSDFIQSLLSENGAFDQLGAKYFDRPYNTPSSDDYRRVLHAMSEVMDDWSSRAELIERTGLKGGTVDNALRALKKQDIIVQDEARAGQYRLPTRSFAAWINIRKRAEQE